MKGLDMREWSLLDRIGVGLFALSVFVPALNALLKDAPAVAERAPAFLAWPFLPAVLFLLGFGMIAYRSFWGARAERPNKASPPGSEERPRMPRAIGAFQLPLVPPSDFMLLPQQYSVEFSATLPHVEVRFYVVSFLPRPIILLQAKVSLRLFGAATLEAITLINEDFEIQPKEARIIVCRRNLSDMEANKLPWRVGRDIAVLQLYAKAVDGNRSLTYGPLGDLAIDGWVNGPLPKAPASG